VFAIGRGDEFRWLSKVSTDRGSKHTLELRGHSTFLSLDLDRAQHVNIHSYRVQNCIEPATIPHLPLCTALKSDKSSFTIYVTSKLLWSQTVC
jgi:hypothetical protein